MYRAPDSFSRSPTLEFTRSSCLERGNERAASLGSITMAFHNGIQGYSFDSGWQWYPTLRVRGAIGGESMEVLWNFASWPSVQNALPPPNIQIEPGRTLISKSAAWLGLNAPLNITTRGALRIEAVNPDGGTMTWTLEGSPMQGKDYAKLFFDRCVADTSWLQAPQAAEPVLPMQIRLDGTSAVGPTLAGQFPLGFSPQAYISTSGFDVPAIQFYSEPPEAFRRRLLLGFYRRRNEMTGGEAVNGAFADFDFDGIFTAFDCTRGATGQFEDVVPPRVPDATIDAIDFAVRLDWAASSQRRLIPPDAPHALITC